jgi:sulfur carrier protein ThiS
MHRGSSKGPAGTPPRPGNLPLSASPWVQVSLVVERAGRADHHSLRVPQGTPVRDVLRSIGQAVEGSAVLSDDQPVPLDLPIEHDARFTVIPTFSGG